MHKVGNTIECNNMHGERIKNVELCLDILYFQLFLDVQNVCCIKVMLFFRERLHNLEKRLLTSSCPSVCMYRLCFPCKLIQGTFMNTWLKSGKNIGTLHEGLSAFHCYRRYKSP